MSATTLIVLGVLATLPCQPPQRELRSGTSQDLRVEAGSEPQLSEQEADAEAEMRLRQALLEAAMNRTGVEVPRAVWARRLTTQILYDASVAREERHAKTVKPYGVFYTSHVAVAVPQATIQRWASEAARHQRLRVLVRAGAAVLTVLAWILGWGMAVQLDRCTRGYCRPGVVLGTLAVMVSITATGWILSLV
jgi:hypothetical protein